MSTHRREPVGVAPVARPLRLLVVLALTVTVLGPALAAVDSSNGPSLPAATGPTAGEQVRAAQVPPGQALITSTGDSPVVGDVLQVPAIDLEAPLVDVALGTNGVLSPPTDAALVGRWNDSAKVGAMKGQSVVAGHTVSSGGGLMNRLGELEFGDRVRATDDGMAVDYIVTSVEKYTRAEVATSAQTLFGQQRESNRLVLVTCADFSADGIYLSNIVVLAYPVRRLSSQKAADHS